MSIPSLSFDQCRHILQSEVERDFQESITISPRTIGKTSIEEFLMVKEYSQCVIHSHTESLCTVKRYTLSREGLESLHIEFQKFLDREKSCLTRKLDQPHLLDASMEKFYHDSALERLRFDHSSLLADYENLLFQKAFEQLEQLPSARSSDSLSPNNVVLVDIFVRKNNGAPQYTQQNELEMHTICLWDKKEKRKNEKIIRVIDPTNAYNIRYIEEEDRFKIFGYRAQFEKFGQSVKSNPAQFPQVRFYTSPPEGASLQRESIQSLLEADDCFILYEGKSLSASSPSPASSSSSASSPSPVSSSSSASSPSLVSSSSSASFSSSEGSGIKGIVGRPDDNQGPMVEFSDSQSSTVYINEEGDHQIRPDLPRDCIDIAVKIAFVLNEAQQSKSRDVVKQLHSLSNNSKKADGKGLTPINFSLSPTNDGTTLRDLQSSNPRLRESAIEQFVRYGRVLKIDSETELKTIQDLPPGQMIVYKDLVSVGDGEGLRISEIRTLDRIIETSHFELLKQLSEGTDWEIQFKRKIKKIEKNSTFDKP